MRANRQGTTETLRRRDDVFARLSRRCPTSLSSCAFDAVAARLQEEEAQCTFVPHVNHTFDAALMPWAAESDVFTRLFGHAKCQQQQQEDTAKVKQKADAVEMEEWRSKFRHMSFPKHLYTCPRPKGRHATSLALIVPYAPEKGTGRTGGARAARGLIGRYTLDDQDKTVVQQSHAGALWLYAYPR
ncbi:hypothetical protein Q4I32_002712 [Leishmania shawi]|uniref:Uncharacterized protein n=1 Tax=Leishmania shawi TaxID=5680 RepID=A0AAW3C1V9_9TRYP